MGDKDARAWVRGRHRSRRGGNNRLLGGLDNLGGGSIDEGGHGLDDGGSLPDHDDVAFSMLMAVAPLAVLVAVTVAMGLRSSKRCQETGDENSRFHDGVIVLEPGDGLSSVNKGENEGCCFESGDSQDSIMRITVFRATRRKSVSSLSCWDS